MLRWLLVIVALVLPATSFAQFFGAAGLNSLYSSNVSGLDTSLPDFIINPSLILGYDFKTDHRFGFSAAAGVSSFQYTSDADRSYAAIFAGITPTYYFLTTNTFFATASSEDTSKANGEAKVMSVAERITMLDNWLKVVIPKLPRMRATLDSAQELLSVVRELLDETSYTTSVKEIVLSELRTQLSSLVRLNSKELENIVREWHALIERLEQTEEESDFLPVDELDLEDERPVEKQDEPDRPLAPLTTLSTSYINYRNLSSTDFYLLGDRSEATEKSIATSLSLPINWTYQSNSDTFQSYTNHQLSLSLRFNIMPSEDLQFSANVDHIRSAHPFDSLYSNATWRLRAATKLVLSERSIGGMELTYGLRRYHDPWSTTIDTFAPRPPRVNSVTFTTDPRFSQLTAGLWYQYLISDEFTMGAVFSIARHPDLRGSVVSQSQDYASSAEDEFNFDHTQIAAFLTTRILEKYDLGVDAAFERRHYGSLKIKGLPTYTFNPEINSLIFSTTASTRTESVFTMATSLSRLFIFENKLAGFVTGMGVEALGTYNTTAASIEDYSYDSFTVSLSASAYF
jgi:hypothetical protein